MKRIDRYLARLRQKDYPYTMRIDRQTEDRVFVAKNGSPDPEYNGKYMVHIRFAPRGLWLPLGEGSDAHEALADAGNFYDYVFTRDHPELYVEGNRVDYYKDGETWKLKDYD